LHRSTRQNPFSGSGHNHDRVDFAEITLMLLPTPGMIAPAGDRDESTINASQ